MVIGDLGCIAFVVGLYWSMDGCLKYLVYTNQSAKYY